MMIAARRSAYAKFNVLEGDNDMVASNVKAQVGDVWLLRLRRIDQVMKATVKTVYTKCLDIELHKGIPIPQAGQMLKEMTIELGRDADLVECVALAPPADEPAVNGAAKDVPAAIPPTPLPA
jgi:hypothetical protein